MKIINYSKVWKEMIKKLSKIKITKNFKKKSQFYSPISITKKIAYFICKNKNRSNGLDKQVHKSKNIRIFKKIWRKKDLIISRK